MHVEHGLIDIIRSAAMVVDDDDAADGFEQRLAFDLIGPVCVDDDEQALRIGREQSLLDVYKRQAMKSIWHWIGVARIMSEKNITTPFRMPRKMGSLSA